jgi:CRISPR-associated Cas5-like protein
MTIGYPDPKVSYPQKKALYPVPVRHNNSLPTASFRSPVTRGTLAFGYQIPVITALLGLGVSIHSPLRFTTCPAHLEFKTASFKFLNYLGKTIN